jgi:Zn-dependent peptidase ImmA (M78 family)
MSRVKEVLDASGLRYGEIARLARLDESRLQEIAAGADFSVAELSAISAALKVPVSSFVQKNERQEKVEFLFRQSFGKVGFNDIPAIDSLSSALANAVEIIRSKSGYLSWLDDFPRGEESYERAEYLADRFRARFFSGDMFSPIFTLPRIVSEELRVLLFVMDEQSVEGASAIIGGRAFIFLSPRSFVPRMFFTLAHELGHLIAGHFGQKDVAYVDKAGCFEGRAKASKKSELFADAFASALLMPASGVGVALQRVRKALRNSGALTDVDLLYLARIFGVSFEVAARRCEDLQLLPKGAARSLHEVLCTKFGSPEKRADELGLPERPRIEFSRIPEELLASAIDRVKRGDLSIGKASEMLKVSISELYGLNAAATVH